jgi:hypothetical protein
MRYVLTSRNSNDLRAIKAETPSITMDIFMLATGCVVWNTKVEKTTNSSWRSMRALAYRPTQALSFHRNITASRKTDEIKMMLSSGS